MSLNAKNVKSNKSRVKQPVLEPAGYPGRLVQVIDFGLQNQRPFKGEEKPPALEIGLTYELSDEFCVDKDGNVEEDKPRWISEIIPFHNLSADKAKSTQRYYAIDPTEDKGGDFTQLLGMPCTVNIVNNVRDGETYNNVGSLSAIRAKDAAKLPQLVGEPSFFSLDEPDLELFNSYPDWIRDKIKGNLNFNGSVLQKALSGKPAPKDDKKGKDPEPQEGEGNGGDVPW